MNEIWISDAKMELGPLIERLWLVLQPHYSITIRRSDADRNTIHKHRK
jgi:hypothetical protein